MKVGGGGGGVVEDGEEDSVRDDWREPGRTGTDK